MAILDILRKRSMVLIIPLVFAAGFIMGNQYAVSAAQSIFSAPADTDELFAPFWQVYNLIQNDYVDPEGDALQNNRLVDGAINGMINALNDDFSGYMDPESFPLLNEDLGGEIEGIGVVIRTLEETRLIEVVEVLESSPAQTAGIQAGDIFIRVDDEDVRELNQTQLAMKVRGPRGTTVNLTMLRGEELVDFSVTRERIVIPNIEQELLDNNIGYVRLNQFSPQARQEIDTAIEELGGDNLDGLILDLRGNPGGLLTASVEVASAFVDEGVLIIEDFGEGREQILEANGSFAYDLPLVVLVNETSASASELVAGAFQDNDRATIIGEATFGKGTVQTWQSLVNGGGIRLTVARWLTPNRNWIHQQGITPDIIVEWDPMTAEEAEEDLQLDAAVAFLEETLAVAATTAE